MKTIEIKFNDLCNEIDYWKEEAEYYKSLYKEEVRRSVEETNKQFEESKRGVANALMFALSVQDNKDGSMSISSKNRKELAKNWNK